MTDDRLDDVDRIPCPSLNEVIEERLSVALDRHALGEQVQWGFMVGPGPDTAPVANVWLSIPMGVVGQSRGGWSHISALEAASMEGENMLDELVRAGLEQMRRERSAFLADPEAFAEAEAQRMALETEALGRDNGLNN